MKGAESLSSKCSTYNEVKEILENLPSSTIEQTCLDIRNTFFTPIDEETLKHVAESIFNFGVCNFTFWGKKYIELAQSLFDLDCQKTKTVRLTFKEIFLKLVIDRFEEAFGNDVHHIEEERTPEKMKMIKFYACLFEAEIVTSTLMSHWLNCVSRWPEVERKLLSAVRPILMRQYDREPLKEQSTTPECSVATLRKISTLPILGKTTTQEAKTKSHASKTANSTINDIDDIVERFTNFLTNIKGNPKPDFNLLVFQTCSEKDRHDCAAAMIDMVLSNQTLPEEYAKTALEIQCKCSLNTKHHNTFGVFLIKECEQMVPETFSESPHQWNKIAALGGFLGYLFLRGCIKQKLMFLWLNKTIEEVLKNNITATKTFLKVMQIILEQLKLMNPNCHKECLRHLRLLVTHGRIPVEFRTWVTQIVRQPSAVLMPPKNSSSSPSPQRDTGVIRKTTQQTHQPELPQTLQSSNQPVLSTSKDVEQCSQLQPNPKTQVYEDFKKYLDILEQPKHVVSGDVLLFKCKNLSSLSKKVLRVCVGILYNRVLDNPDKIQMYAYVTACELLPNVSEPTKETFVKHLSHCFEMEMKKSFTLESPEMSNWARVNDVGLFLGELYNHEVIEFPAVNLWIEGIFQFVLKECAPAFELLLRFLKIIALRLKNSNAPVFDLHMRQAEENFSNANIIFQLKHRTIMEELRNIQKPTTSDEKAASVSNMAISTHLAPTGDLFESLSVFTLADLKKHLDGMKLNKSGIKTFAFNFFDRIIKIKDFKFHARLAQMIDSEISSKQPESEGSFKVFLFECLHKNVNSLKPFEAAKAVALEDRGVSAVRFIGEMFNLGMIEDPWTIIDSKLECYFELRLFSVMLETIGMKLQTKNDDGALTAKLEVLKKNSATFKDMQRAFICEDLIGQLECILNFAYNNVNNTAEAVNLQRIKPAINAVKAENINGIVGEIQSVDIKNETQIHQIVKFIMEKENSDCEGSTFLTQLIANVQSLSAHHSFSFKEKLIEKYVETLIEILQSDIDPSQHLKATATIQFIVELFSLNHIGSKTFELIIDAILENGSDNAFDLLDLVLIKIGLKLDEEIKEKIDEYFEKFEAIANHEVSFRSLILTNLIRLRKNNWIALSLPSKLNSSATCFGDLIPVFPQESFNVTAKAFKELISSSTDDTIRLIHALWEAIVTQPDQVKVQARLTSELCNKIDFVKSFAKFLKCRFITLHSISFDEYSDTTRQRLSNVMLFVGELYVLNCVSDETLEFSLKAAKRIPRETLEHLITLINSKVNLKI